MSKKPPFNNPFAALHERIGPLPSAPESLQPAAPPKPAQLTVARAVVRIERKGRGGKVATLVEKLELPHPRLEQWLKELKRSLGCGGVIEGDSLVLQGDLRDRVKSWLQAHGVRKVTIG